MKHLIPGGNDPSGFGIRNGYAICSHLYLHFIYTLKHLSKTVVHMEFIVTKSLLLWRAKIQFSMFKHCLQTSALICIIKLNFNSFLVNSSFVQHMGRSWMNFSFLQQVMYTELLSTQIACLNSVVAIYFLLCLVNRLGNYST